MTENLSEREQKIVELLADDASMSVGAISKQLDVSTVTIRNDLSSLAEKGIIIRTHGGAFPVFHQSILERQKERVRAKTGIAKAAAELIQDGEAVMIEAGTTTARIARYLLGKRDLHVVTNSTLVIPFARVNPGIHLTMVGGEFRPLTESLVGPVALRHLEEFFVKTAFIGTDGLTLEYGLTTHLVEGAEIVRKMAAQAERTVLVADSSKFGKVGFARVLPLEAIDMLITDSELTVEARSQLEAIGLEIRIA